MMKQLQLSEVLIKKLQEHEEQLYTAVSKIVDAYRDRFKQYQCDVVFERSWRNFLSKKISNKRLPFSKGYTCLLSCTITHNGTMVCIDDREGFSLSAAWEIAVISIERYNKLFAPKALTVSCFDVTKDAVEDLNSFYDAIQQYSRETQ